MKSMKSGLLFLLGTSLAAAQQKSKFRCIDKSQECATWKKSNQCDQNWQYMVENCPVACGMCENLKLEPTPSAWDFDFICKGKLATPAKLLTNQKSGDMPKECSFQCRDKLTTCAKEAEEGGCDKAAEGMRQFCPATCGVCKFHQLPVVERDSLPLPKCKSSDADEQCPKWAEKGECVRNPSFMGDSCALACGLCAEDGVEPLPMEDALRNVKKFTGELPPKKKKKKKKKKKGNLEDGGIESEKKDEL